MSSDNMPQQPPRIKGSSLRRERPASTFEQRTDESRKFYQSYTWRKFRTKVKKQHRRKDEQIVARQYIDMKRTTLEAFNNWMAGDNPACVQCFDEGKITPGNVADHITRIRNGGEPLAPDNIQFLCQYHHNVKSGKEAHDNQ